MRDSTIQFDDFYFDPNALSLTRDGRQVPLRPQSARALQLLISHSGQVVSREELIRHLWGEGIYVDFETALNTCMRRLRRALRDHAGEPRYIRTLPGRGYLFIADTRRIEAPDRASGSTVGERVIPPADDPAPPRPSRDRLEPEARLTSRLFRSRPRRWAAAIGAVFVLGLGVISVGGLWPPSEGPPVGFRGSRGGASFEVSREHLIVMAATRFSGLSPELEDAFRITLQSGLESAAGARLLTPEALRSTLARMTLPAGTALGRDLALEVGQRQGADSVLLTSVHRFGQDFALEADLVDPFTGRSQATPRARASSDAELLPALQHLVEQISQDLATLPAGLRAAGRDLRPVTTPNLKALHAYSRANELIWQEQPEAAEALLRHALQLDSGFAMAHIRLALLLRNTGRTSEAIFHLRSADSRGSGLSRYERLYSDAWRHTLEGRAPQAFENWLLLRELYPERMVGHFHYGLLRASFQGDFAGCVQVIQEALAAAPGPCPRDSLRHHLLYCQIGAGQMPQAAETAAALSGRGELSYGDYLYWVVLGEGEELERRMRRWQEEVRIPWSRGDTYLVRGLRRAVEGDLEGSLSAFRIGNEAFSAEGDEFGRAWAGFSVLALLDALGRQEELRREIRDIDGMDLLPVGPLEMDSGTTAGSTPSMVAYQQQSRALLGILAARSGELKRARSILRSIAAPRESGGRGHLWEAHRALLVAEIEAAQGDLEAAVATLRKGLASSPVFPLHAKARLGIWLQDLGQSQEASTVRRWVTQNPGRAVVECIDFATCLDRPLNVLALLPRKENRSR